MDNTRTNAVKRTQQSASSGRRRGSSGKKPVKEKNGLTSLLFRIGRGMDWGFFGMVMLLVTVGLVMLYSASYPISYYENKGNSSYIFTRQCLVTLLGFVVMIAMSFFRYDLLKKKWVITLILAVQYLALIAVLVIGAINGSDVKRWIGVGSVTIQASEITKLAMIIFMAYFCDKFYGRDGPILIVGIVMIVSNAALLLMEPHYSAIVIVSLLIIVMMFLGGVRFRWFIVFGAIAAVVVIVLVTCFPDVLGYAMERLDGWGMALTAEYGTDLYEQTRQTRNSMYAIGSGGFGGLGFGESRQKYLFLAEPQNDFIFAIICEELGFVGAVLILALFALLVYQGIKISQQARDRFGRLLGCGLVLQIAIQVILNICVITDLLPNTGISLPFFSSGGSATVVLMAQMGLVLSISRTANMEKL